MHCAREKGCGGGTLKREELATGVRHDKRFGRVWGNWQLLMKKSDSL